LYYYIWGITNQGKGESIVQNNFQLLQQMANYRGGWMHVVDYNTSETLLYMGSFSIYSNQPIEYSQKTHIKINPSNSASLI